MSDEIDQLSTEETERVFEFLDDLRESGRINMFAAPGELEDEFGFSAQLAMSVFIAWTEQFSDNNG